jgi:hypothetical protein
MVILGGAYKFYKRTGLTKNPMSVEEIRRAFSEQGELGETISRWRAHRLKLIELDEGPVALTKGVITLFHIIPAEAFTPGAFNEAWRIPASEKTNVHVPDGNLVQRYNADGFLCHGSTERMTPRPGAVTGYTQIFRSGIIEYGFSYQPRSTGSAPQAIYGQVLEKEIVYCYQDANNRLRRDGRTGALYVGFSLLGIAGKSFYSNHMAMAFRDHEYEIRQNTFSSPEVYVDLSEPAEGLPFPKTLRPLVDTLWQVGGLEQTPCILFDGHERVWNPFATY